MQNADIVRATSQPPAGKVATKFAASSPGEAGRAPRKHRVVSPHLADLHGSQTSIDTDEADEEVDHRRRSCDGAATRQGAGFVPKLLLQLRPTGHRCHL